jgi:hypothetical protein
VRDRNVSLCKEEFDDFCQFFDDDVIEYTNWNYCARYFWLDDDRNKLAISASIIDTAKNDDDDNQEFF